jgi:Tfp pilus assembly protein PilF
MPLGWLTLCALFHVNGLDPFWYHSAALGFYLANAVLVYVLALHTIRAFVPAAAAGLTAWQAFAAFLAAGWWALHPLRVESTAWISGLLYGQAATFFLVAVIAYRRSYRGRRRLPWIAASLAAATASLATYPIALGLPFLLLAMDLYRSRTEAGRGAVPLRRLACEKLLFLAPVAAIALFTAYARLRNPAVWGSVPTFAEFPLTERLMQAAYIVSYYVWRPLWPGGLPPITPVLLGFDLWAPAFTLGAAAILVITSCAVAWRRSRPWVGAVWLAYLATVVPFAGFTEHPYNASDRYAYLPTVVWAAALACGLACLRAARWRLAASAAALGLIAVLGATTRRALGIWSDPRTMYAYLVGSLPEGEEHDRILSRFAMFEYLFGNPGPARTMIGRAARDFPASPEILKVKASIEGTSDRLAPGGERVPIAFMHYQMGLYFLRAGQPAEGREQLRRALRLDPALFQADFDLAVLDASGGRPRDAAHHLLLAEARAGASLPPAKRVACLELIQASARQAGDAPLDRALAARLGREAGAGRGQ